MKLKREVSVAFPLSLALLVASLTLKGPPADPDQFFGMARVWGVTLFALWYCVCAMSWGRIVLERLKFAETGLALSLATGTALASVLGFALGHLGLVGFQAGPWILFVLQLGPLLCPKDATPLKPMAFHPAWVAGLAALAYVLFSRLLNAQILHGAGDPLVYHLYGPRLWAEAGRIFLPRWEPLVLQCSWWEMQLLLAQSMLGAPAGRGLIEGQLFGQALHVLAGVGGCFLALELLFRGRLHPSFWLFPLLLASLLSTELATSSALAKNDWGVMLWILSGAALLLTPREASIKPLALGGWFLGMACIAKPNSVYFVAALLIAWLIQELQASGRKWRPALTRDCLWMSFMMSLGIAPIALRNFFMTGNPFFPFIMAGTNPDLFTPGELRFRLARPVTWYFDPAFWWRKLKWIVSESWMNAGVYILPLIGFVSRDSRLKRLAWISVASMLWIHMANIPHAIVRWAGVPLMLAPTLLLLFLVELLNRKLSESRAILRLHATLCIALTLVLTWKTQMPFWRTLPEELAPSQILRRQATHWGGDSKAWLRQHASLQDKILSIGDNQLYYLSSLKATSLMGDVDAAKLTDGVDSPLILLQELRNLGVRYVLDTSQPGTAYNFPQALLLKQLTQVHPKANVFQGARSSVVDLNGF